jgi:STE24 endopeptidase
MRLRHLCLLLLLVLSCVAAHASTPTEARALAQAAHDTTAYTLPRAALARASALEHRRAATHFGGEVWGILIVIFLLRTRTVARMRNFANNMSKNRWAQCYLFTFLFLLAVSVLGSPWSIYSHQVAVAYGLSVQGWASWLGDAVKAFLLTLLVGGFILWVLFWRIRRSPRQWWWQIAAFAGIFTIAGLFITPYVIDPLFNRFEPLQQTNPALVARLEQVVAKARGVSIPPDRMYLMHASDKVTTANAYVTGFGSSKRVVVWDTSIKQVSPDEITFIFAHEMGHYVLRHVLYGTLLGIAEGFLFFFLAFHGLHWLLRRYGAAWRVPGQDNWAAAAVLYLILLVFAAVSEPFEMAVIRGREHAADVYGQEAIHGLVQNPQAVAQHSFDSLGASSYDEPDPPAWLEWWTYSHPSISHRAAFAKYYNPWAPGEGPKYFPK